MGSDRYLGKTRDTSLKYTKRDLEARIAKEKKEKKRRETGTNPNQMMIDFDKAVVNYVKQRQGKNTVDNTIGWVGGKHKIAKRLIAMMPPHQVYCEVFFGGGAIFFKKPKSEASYINDLNSNLTNMYTVMRDNGEEFWKYAHYFLYARDIFELAHSKYGTEEWKNLSSVQRSVIFFYMIRVAFNNNVNAGYFSKDQKYSIWDEYQKVIKIGEKLQNVCIENIDYRKFIKGRLSENANKDKKILFYLDPPYVVAEKADYYEYLFTNTEHSDLARLCDSIDKGGHYFMLSYEDIPLLRDIYRSYHIADIEFKYSMATGSSKEAKIGKEIIVTNFKIANEQLDLLEDNATTDPV